MRVCILLQPGYGCTADETCGLSIPCQELRRRYPDAKIMIHEHDYEVEALIPAMLPYDYWIHWGHSFGVGHGLLRACSAAWLHHRYFDLAITVDSVPDMLGQHFIRTEKPFPNFPENVLEVLSMRTLNKPDFFHPWGRRVDHPNVAKQIVYASDVGFGSDTQYIIDPTVTHTNIDSDVRGHEAAYKLIAERIAPAITERIA